MEVAERGVFVEMHPGLPPVLIHVSQLSATKVSKINILNLLKMSHFESFEG